MRKLFSDEGTEIAEAALVLPLMFLILMGIFWFGQAFSVYGTITTAAQNGARAAALAPECATCPRGPGPLVNARTAIRDTLQAAHLDPRNIRRTATRPVLQACGGGVAACDPAETNMCVEKIQNSPGRCRVYISFEYPMNFIGKATLHIPANAMVSMEN